MHALGLLTITIGIDPEIAKFGGLLLTWHGVFTAVGIAAGVYFAVLAARKVNYLNDDEAYTIALIGVPSAIVGARALYVMERWDEEFAHDLWSIFAVNEGGISIYGAVIGGILGGLIYGWIRRFPIRRGLDIGSMGLLLGMAIGRIGDIINGEHFASESSLPWAVKYTHINSPSFMLPPQHPAVAYEMLGDLAILGVMYFFWNRRILPRDGQVFSFFLLAYGVMRFLVSYLREDSLSIGPFTWPQVVSLGVIFLGLATAALFQRMAPRDWVAPRGAAQPEPAGAAQKARA